MPLLFAARMLIITELQPTLQFEYKKFHPTIQVMARCTSIDIHTD
jgi:hypothetical protein